MPAAAGSARCQTSRFIHRQVRSSPGADVGGKVDKLLLFACVTVWLTPFSRLAVAEGRAFGRPPQAAAGCACTHISRFIHRRAKTSPGADVGRKVVRATTLRLF